MTTPLAQLSRRLRLPSLVVLAVVLVVWELVARRYGPYVLPSPGSVVRGLATIIQTGELWKHTGASLYRIALGFGGALAVAVLLGLAAFLWGPVRVAVRDLVTVLNSTSVFVWIVVSLIWFGLTDMAPIFTTFMITLPVVGANVVEGVESVDRRLLEMGQVYRLSGWEKFRSIVIPSTIPYLVAGMKVGFGLALKVSVVAEIFGVTTGIGYIMNYSREILATQMVFVWAVVMICIMLLTDKLLFESLTRRLERWR
ncbi:MAG: ABC transporter permease [Candidatus Rokubacteria bacterium]|nr:ABC transporter permease [Candidatus Rokubacteria bacterium]